MLPNEKGSYQARPLKWRVGKSKSGAVELAADLELFGQWNGSEWCQCNYAMAGYFYLITKEGNVNEKTVEQVEQAFGWDRRTGLSALANSPELPDCQVFCDFEEYNGNQKIKVKWLSPFDKVPGAGVGESDPQEVQDIDRLFGPKLRGSAPARSAPPATKPAPAAKPAAVPAAAQLDIAKRAAWEAFKAKNPGGNHVDDFKAALHAYFDGRPGTSLGSQEWVRFKGDNFVKPVVESPIGDESVFSDDPNDPNFVPF